MKRTLSLKRESLTDLTSADLAAVAGAAASLECFEVNSLDPLTTCVATLQQSRVVCSGSICNTYNSDCSCRV